MFKLKMDEQYAHSTNNIIFRVTATLHLINYLYHTVFIKSAF